MDILKITGGVPLHGVIPISGAKNAALPLMAASLLTPETIILHNTPYLADIVTMANLLAQHGVGLGLRDSPTNVASHYARSIELTAAQIHNLTAPYDLVRTMRASVLVLGPLLARFGRARVSLPGGCAIGTRPVDMHLSALEQMGATIELTEGYVEARAKKLHGAEIFFDKVSVGATENILMAATLADGETILHNAAREPEIVDLAHLLQKMGAEITGEGTSEIRIRGVTRLHGAEHAVIADRIETGTYAAAAAITGGDVELLGGRMDILGDVADVFAHIGVVLTPTERGIRATRAPGPLKPVEITTQPHPGFATDMQAQLMALMCLGEGNSVIHETIFENRFMHVPELVRMGAKIHIDGHSAHIQGVNALKGAEVMATDLRASVSLVIAALSTDSETIINRIYHLDRGYERLEEKLAACGARVERAKG